MRKTKKKDEKRLVTIDGDRWGANLGGDFWKEVREKKFGQGLIWEG